MKQLKSRIGMKAVVSTASCLISFVFVLLINMHAHASFDDTGLGARPAAMGQAFTAVSNDANAANTNPAGLAWLSNPELAASYGRLYTGLGDDSKIGQGYFGLAFPVKKYVPGFMSVSWDEVRLSEAYSETAFAVSYSTAVYSGLAAGANLKYLRKSYTSDLYTAADPLFIKNGYSKSGLALDLGGLYRLNGRCTLGLTVKNIGRPDMGIATGDRIPMQVKTGVAYWMHGSVVAMDVSFRGGDFDAAVGAERVIQQKFAFRLGLLAGNNSRRSVSLGFGSRFGSLNFDYAFALPVSGIAGTSGSHRLAFGFKFGAIEQAEAESRADAQAIKAAKERLAAQEEQIKTLEEKIKAVKAAKERLAEQEEQIRTLKEKNKAQEESLKKAAALGEAVKVVAPEPAAPAPPADARLEALKAELEKSRKEAENFKIRLMSLEERSKKKETAPKPAELQIESPSKTYLVQEGDTLETISLKVYGDASKWSVIYKANPGVTGRGGEVKPGQTLIMP